MDLQFKQIEAKLLNATYWNYDLYNTETEKDNWNCENFSLLGPHHEFRQRDVVVRPYPMRSSAEPTLLLFDIGTKHCVIALQGSTVSAATIIYVPNLHYPEGFEVRATGATLDWDASRQLLEWMPDTTRERNQVIICPPDAFDAETLPSQVQESLPFTPFLGRFSSLGVL